MNTLVGFGCLIAAGVCLGTREYFWANLNFFLAVLNFWIAAR